MKFRQKINELLAKYEHEPYSQYYLARINLQQYLIDRDYLQLREW